MDRLALHGGLPVRKTIIPYGKQYIDENDINAVNEVLKSSFLTTGPTINEFENRLCETTKSTSAVAISNGTAALHGACYAAGIGPGDEVITTPITFAASANAVLYCGGKPVFADIDRETWNIDPQAIEKKITPRTKAVIAVDFTGQAVQIDEIKGICKEHQLTFIQDAAHSIGTRYKGEPVGGLADMTTFSFHPVKTITTGEGGAVTTSNEAFYRKLKLFRTHGITRENLLINHKPYDGYNEQVELGYNYRMTDLQAALGLSQLEKLEMFSNRRKELVRMYNRAFSNMPELIIQKEIPDSDTTRHLYILRLNTKRLKVGRDVIFKALGAENIGLQVHYMPVYYHPYYQKLGYNKGICPHAEELYEETITIPLFYGMSDSDVHSVVEAVNKVVKYYKR